MCNFLRRSLGAIVLTMTALACATGGDASTADQFASDAGDPTGETGSAVDGGMSAGDSGSRFDAGVVVDSGVAIDSGVSVDSGTAANDVFVPPPQDGGAGQDSATQAGNCDTSTQASQQKYLAEYLIAAASQNPKPCGTCSTSECCFQILCVPQ
jgi:hypothetical protein